MAEFDDLKTGAERIRDEVTDYANSASRIGTWNINILNWIKPVFEKLFTATVTVDPNTSPSNKAVSDALDKKADETKTVSGITYSVVRTEGGTIPTVDLSLYAKTTTTDGIVVRTADGKIPSVDISGKADKTIIYNVSQANTNYAYTTKALARAAVTTTLRGLGQIIAYKITTGWVTEQYIGTDISGWATETNWKEVGSGATAADLAKKADLIKADNAIVLYSDVPYTFELDFVNVGYSLYNGNLTAEAAYKTTDFIRIGTLNLNSYLLYSGTIFNAGRLFIAFYDVNDKYISGLAGNAYYGVVSRLKILIPTTANSIRFSTLLATADISVTGTPLVSNAEDIYTHLPSFVEGIGHKDAPNLWSIGSRMFSQTISTTTGAINTGMWATLGFETKFTEFKELTKYLTNGTGVNGQFFCYDADYVWLGMVTVTAVAGELSHFTTFENTKYMRWNVSLNSDADKAIANNLIIREASVVEALKSKNSVVLSLPDLLDAQPTEANPNIYDESNFIWGKQIMAGGTITARWDNLGYTDNYTPVLENQRYSLNVYAVNGFAATVAIYNVSKVFMWFAEIINDAIIIPSGGAFIRVNVIEGQHLGQSIIRDSKNVYFPNLLVPAANIIDEAGASPYQINMRNDYTFVGGMNTILDALYAVKPRSRVAMVSHFTVDGSQNGGNGWLSPLVRTQEAFARYRSIYFLDLAEKMYYINRDGINTLQAWIPDTVHPANDATQVVADDLTARLTEFLRPIFADKWTGKKVGIYGTSISAGSDGYFSTVGWGKFIDRAVTALGGIPYNYSVTGSAVRLKNTGGVKHATSFMDLTNNWNYQVNIINRIGTEREPDLHVFEYAFNDFQFDPGDFKKTW